MKTFFAEGGSQCYVTRVVGGTASLGTLTIVDRAAVTPLNTVRVDAQNAGAWSSTMTVEVLDGSLPSTFRIIVRIAGVIVQDITNMTSPADAVTKFSLSPYIRVADLGSATAASLNNPKVQAATALSAGNDQRASVVAATYTASLDKFNADLGDGAVGIPGIGTTVHAGLVTHAAATRRIALLTEARNATVSTLSASAATRDSEYAGLFAPWVLVSDDAGGSRAISPEGYVAAVRARAHDVAGPWRAPGGEIAKGQVLLGVDQTFTRTEGDTLDAARVSAIRMISNSVRLYGWRSLSTNESDYALLTGRDLLNRLVVEGEKRLEQYVFQAIDSKGQLLSAVNAELIGMVEPIAQAGGLFGKNDAQTGSPIDPGYKVTTDSSVNTPASLATNTINALLSVRVSPTAALVTLVITKVGILAAV